MLKGRSCWWLREWVIKVVRELNVGQRSITGLIDGLRCSFFAWLMQFIAIIFNLNENNGVVSYVIHETIRKGKKWPKRRHVTFSAITH